MALSPAKSSTTFRLSEGRSDLRSWPVEAEGGHRIGTVHDYLVDEDGSHLRYLDVALDDRDDRVLIPVAHARVDADAKRVRLPGLGRDAVRDVPAWSGRPDEIDAAYERRIGRAWDERYGESYHRRPDFYGHRPGGIDSWKDRSGTLARLDELDDYEVADHETDPRGWPVVDRDGETIGVVDHLIGDTGIMKVRYFVIDLADASGTGDHHILVPAGHAELDHDAEQVVVEGIDATVLPDLPRYPGGAVDREHEERVTRAWRDAVADEHRYRHPRYRESSLWGETTTRR